MSGSVESITMGKAHDAQTPPQDAFFRCHYGNFQEEPGAFGQGLYELGFRPAFSTSRWAFYRGAKVLLLPLIRHSANSSLLHEKRLATSFSVCGGTEVDVVVV